MTPRPWLLWLAAASAVVAAITAPMWASMWRDLLEGEPAPLLPVFVAASILGGVLGVAIWMWPHQWLAAGALGVTHLVIAVMASTSPEAGLLVAEHFLVGVFALAWAGESLLATRSSSSGSSSPRS